jgi:hypothetical protein
MVVRIVILGRPSCAYSLAESDVPSQTAAFADQRGFQVYEALARTAAFFFNLENEARGLLFLWLHQVPTLWSTTTTSHGW